MLLTLIFVMLGFLMILPLVSFMGTGLKTSRIYNQKADTLYAADAGIEDAMWQIKYDHLASTLTSPAAYDEFDFSTEWEYTLPQEVNQNPVDVTIKNVWIPYEIEVLTTTEARLIADNDQLLVTGGMVGGTETEYKVTVTYSPLAGENLLINSIGVWLPQGFTYAEEYNLEALNPEVVTNDYKGGQSVVWNFNSIDMLDFPEVDTLDAPMTFDLSFTFTPTREGAIPDVVSWMETSGVTGLEFCWDYDVKVFKIISECDQTSVETYVAKTELRQLNGALMGDYIATGNTLMKNAYNLDGNYIRDTWLDAANHSSSSTIGDIDTDAEVEAAFLYWTGWKAESQITNVAPLNPEDCADLSAWTTTSPNSWSVSSSTYRGHYTSGDVRDLQLTNPINLGTYSGAKVALTWQQKVGTITAFSDSCGAFTNWTTGADWTISSGRFRAHHSTGSESNRLVTLAPALDLSAYSSQSVVMTWSQDEGDRLESTDSLYYAFSGDNGATWSANILAFANDDPLNPISPQEVPAQYLTSQFKIRFYIDGFAENSECAYLDNIKFEVTPKYSTTDGLDFAIYNSDTGWSDNIQAFRGNIEGSFIKYHYFLPPQYITSDFKVRFSVADCADIDEYVYIDDIYVKVMYPDNQVFFKVNNVQVYYDGNGEAVAGTGELTADRTDVLLNITSNTYKGFSYTGYKDVTELVKNYSNGGDQQASPPTYGNGNGTFTTGHVDATLGIDGGDYQLAHAGWALIIVYSSPDTYGHQLFLYDRFTYADDDTTNNPTRGDLDFDKNGTPGGDISGFIIPERITNELGQLETDAARITCFVGEGDEWIDPEFIALNAPEQYWDIDFANNTPSAIPATYKLWDQEGTATNNGSTVKNNVWNGLSPVCSADGIDIDTFTITWDSGLISEGDTTAHIDFYTDNDNWNLVFMILSFRSETTTGGSLSYLIRG